MTAVELQEERPEVRGDLGDLIHGVRLEVEKLRTQMAELESRMVGKMAELETRMVGRMDGKISELDTKLSDRIDGLERSLRGWLVVGVSVIGAMIALLGVFG